jgi:hypothetical protein
MMSTSNSTLDRSNKQNKGVRRRRRRRRRAKYVAFGGGGRMLAGPGGLRRRCQYGAYA